MREQFLVRAHLAQLPLCITRIVSARCTVESRCAISTLVRLNHALQCATDAQFVSYPRLKWLRRES